MREKKSVPGYNPSVRWSALQLAAGAFFFLSHAFTSHLAHATDCSGTDITWTGNTSTAWGNTANWDLANIPDNNPSTENAVVVAAPRNTRANSSVTINCMEIESGQVNGNTNGTTLTITGPYFRNLNSGSLNVVAGRTWKIDMSGSLDQTFENVDTLNYLVLSKTGTSTVTLTEGFDIRDQLDLSGMASGTTVSIQAMVTINSTSTVDLVIPAGVTLEIANGGSLRFLATGVGRKIQVDGTLKVKSGSSLVMGNGNTIDVTSTGYLRLEGASGDIARIDADASGSSYTLTVANQFYGNYFKLSRMDASGLNLTGTANVQNLDYGEFHNLANGGYGITVSANVTIPTTMDTLGFFDDDGHGNTQNFNVSGSYAGAGTTVNDWSGDAGGETLDNDVNNLISWGTQASVKLTLSNSTASGNPPSTIGLGSADTYFATYAFGLNQTGSATDVTDITLTMSGTAVSADLARVQVFKDHATLGTKCVWDGAGTDVQVGGDLAMTGNPPTASVSFSAGDVQTSGVTPACIHVLAATSAIALDKKTIQFKISGTSDVTTSPVLSFSESSGPPVSSGFSKITGGGTREWRGGTSTAWSTGTNWSGNNAPNQNRNCDVGPGSNTTNMDANPGLCRTARLLSGGTLSFAGTTNSINLYGHLEVQSGYTFNAPYGVFTFVGSENQSMKIETEFPGNVSVNQSVGTKWVSVDADSIIGGNLDILSGTLIVNDGVTLEVKGNITINGGTLEIAPGGTLKLANGSTLTLTTGTLRIVGTSTQTALITSNAGGAAYTVTLNGGTVEARYYTFDHLGTNGVTVNSGVTIDGTNYFQDGTFSYPVNDDSTFLRLFTNIPGDTLSDMSFDSGGSIATGIFNIYTDGSIGAGTLSITSYSGAWGGESHDSGESTYDITWSGATTTIDLTQDATSSGDMNAGDTYVMGRFGFQLPETGYNSTDITSLKLTMTGTGSGSDVSQVRAYFETDCNSSGGSQIGSGTFSGNPATVTFSGITGATIPGGATPTKVCVYVEYDIANGAGNGNTVGVKINAGADLSNSEGYAISGSTPPPVTLGSPRTIIGSSTTTWTGSADVRWSNASNWSAGLPDSTKNCEINSASFNPSVDDGLDGTATCKAVIINSGGALTLENGTGATLEVYANFTNSGTFTQNDGTLIFRDTGSSTEQTITSGSSLGTVTFNKTLGGTAKTGGSLTIGTLTLPTGSNFEFQVLNGHTLTLQNDLDIQAGTFDIKGGGTVALADTKRILVTGGTFEVSGTNDIYDPEGGTQSSSNKGKVTRSGGSGRWGFLATSGTVDITGFFFDYIDVDGLRIHGSTNLTNLRGGQFTHLLQDWSTPVKAIQINSTGTMPASSTNTNNVGFMWDDFNSFQNEGGWCACAPGTSDNYYLVYAPACGGATITFDQWFGDFFISTSEPLTEDKIYDTDDGGPTCQVAMAASASPVALLSFDATGFEGAVSLDWETGSELDHVGFNVYRSLEPHTGFIQVNSTLIRNFKTSTLFHGIYRYVDEDVINGLTYYYRIEDVATNGSTTMHGPVHATPDVGKGSPLPDGSSTNSGASTPGAGAGNAPASGPIDTPDLIDLGNGVHILSQTENFLRIEIVPPPETLSAAGWNAAYETLVVPGFSSMIDPGKPELVERQLLVEVNGSPTSVSVQQATIEEGTPSSHQISPVPTWSPDINGILQPSWNPDPTAYASSSYYPSEFQEVSNSIVDISGKKYVQIKVRPFLYKASSQELRKASKITLDISLDGASWPNTPPSGEIAQSPSAVEGTLRIRYTRSGMYELRYEDLVSTGLEAPFAGADTTQFRLYYRGQEVPIEVISGTGSFSPGDRIRFYSLFEPSVEDPEDEAVLSRVPLAGSSGAPLRIQLLNGDPTGYPLSDEAGGFAQAYAEQDLMPLFDAPLADLVDHFYWGRIYEAQGTDPPSASAFIDLPIQLPALIPSSERPVRIRLHVRGVAGIAANPEHHVGVWVNQVPFMLADKSFQQSGPTILTFDIPSAFFVAGQNVIRAQVLADRVPNGDWDIVDINRVEVDYTADRVAIGGIAHVYNHRLNHQLTITGFSSSSDIHVYDITEPTLPYKLDQVEIASFDGGITHEINFAADSGVDYETGSRFIALEAGEYLEPSALTLGRGADVSLRAASNGADLIVVGSDELLASAEELIAARTQQGLRVVQAPVEQIYAEFGHGRRTSQALRDFALFAHENWVAPAPKYLLILGDGTYDPKDHLGLGVPVGPISNHLPMPLEKGEFFDFGNDHWFVSSSDSSGLPLMAVGRIPTRNPEKLRVYVQKLLDYEAGSFAPSGDQAKRLVFISDTDTMNEGFALHSDALAASAVSTGPGFTSGRIDRTEAGSDGATRSAILDAFDQGPLAVTYLGHGAEDRWAGGGVFTNAEAASLNNSKLPIVLGLNCLNSYFYEADPGYESLGEKMIFNSSGGAIAFWGSTTMTMPTAQVALARGFFEQLGQETSQPHHDIRIGDLMLRAKVALGTQPSARDTLKSYTLFGDPSMRLPAAAFAPAPTPTASSNASDTDANESQDDQDSGFLSCATVSGPGPGSGPGSAGAAAEALLMLMLLLASRRLFSPTVRGSAAA